MVRGAAVHIVILIVILVVVILINHCCHRGHTYHHRHHSSHPHPHHGYRQLVGPSVVHIPQDDSDFKANWDFIHRDPVLALGQTQSNLSKNAHLFDSCAELCHKNIASAARTAYSNPPR